MTDKVDRLEKLMVEMLEIYKAKNADYGDSFADSFKEFGIISAVVRMNDKMNRIKSLSKGEDRQVKDESLSDSLMDLANYALMTVIELENEQMRGIKGEPGMRVNSDTFDINEFRENLKSGFGITHNYRPLKTMFGELDYSDDEHDWIDKDIEDSKTRYWLKYKGEADIYFEKFDIINGFVEFKDCADRWEMTFDEVCEAIEKYKLNIDNFELMKVKRENFGTIERPDAFEAAVRDYEREEKKENILRVKMSVDPSLSGAEGLNDVANQIDREIKNRNDKQKTLERFKDLSKISIESDYEAGRQENL